MDGIAAIEARVAEICARFAPPPPPSSAAVTTGDAFAAHLRRAMGTGAPAAATGVGRAVGGNVDAWIDEAIARLGVPASWAPALRTIARPESSFNPAAVNLAAAGGNLAKAPQGLMQMLPTTFAAHVQAGHGDILNPVDNVMAAIDYIRRRYGDPSSTPGMKALARGQRYVGY